MRDNAAQLGLPPMQLHQQIENLAAFFSHNRRVVNKNAAYQNNKRKRPELDRDEDDMEVDEDSKDFIFKELKGFSERIEIVYTLFTLGF